MQCEERRAQPRAGDTQAFENGEKKDRARRVQKNIYGVITERLQTPCVEIEPKTCVGERIILLRGARLKPDGTQAGKSSQREIFSDVGVVIPDEFPGARAQISQNNGGE